VNVKGPLRNRSLGTKLTEVEYASVEAAALRAGIGLSEWCRRAVLELAEREGVDSAGNVVVAELLSLRAVLLNVLFRLSRGESISEDEMRQLIDRADRDKHKRAAAVLSAGRDDER
jgi:hypothetical protein